MWELRGGNRMRRCQRLFQHISCKMELIHWGWETGGLSRCLEEMCCIWRLHGVVVLFFLLVICSWSQRVQLCVGSTRQQRSDPPCDAAPLKRRKQAAELSVVLNGSPSGPLQVDLLSPPHTNPTPQTLQEQGGQSRPPRTGSCWAWLESRPNLSFMAVARKIKTLLTVNILVFVGIILFSVYCRIQDRSEELIQIGRISDQRLRARNGKVSNLVDRQSILQRLERLEDVVYNQLNGRKQLQNLGDVKCECLFFISVGFIIPMWWG